MQHIIAAESRVGRLHAEQLDWLRSATFIERMDFAAARTRALLRVAANSAGATPDQLHELDVFMCCCWSVDFEEFIAEGGGNDFLRAEPSPEFRIQAARRESVGKALKILTQWPHLKGLVATTFGTLWLDIVVETDEWARRHASARELRPVRRVPLTDAFVGR